MAETVASIPFLWEGKDRRGKKVKGRSMAATEQAVRADLRRQGVVPTRIRKQRARPFSGKSKSTTGDIMKMPRCRS